MSLSVIDEARPVVITGGAGFIGCNLAQRLLRDGRRVLIFDNLSRRNVERNLAFLKARHGSRLEVLIADVREANLVTRAVQQASAVFHLAAQVAVTTSLQDPLTDFDVNVRGTLNVLEALRAMRTPAPLLFTSTNKVYGALDDLALVSQAKRYAPTLRSLDQRGVSEGSPLDFHSPYGCSKGAADQYVRDYARSYGIPAVVFRMSCIYGARQYGTEDQGWLAHFLIRALQDEPITLYGDGRQVRDVLYVDDLVEAMYRAHAGIAQLSGEAFNIGGGAENTVSLLELLDSIERLSGKRPRVELAGPRTGDQRYYVSDISRFRSMTGWQPKIGVQDGVKRLSAWVGELLRSLHPSAPKQEAIP